MNHTTSPTVLFVTLCDGLWISSLVVQFGLYNILSLLTIIGRLGGVLEGVWPPGPGVWHALDPSLSLVHHVPCSCCHQILLSCSLKNVIYFSCIFCFEARFPHPLTCR